VADVTRTIHYIGPAGLAGAGVHCLKEEGVQADWTPPEEERGLPEAAQTLAAVVVIVRGTAEAIGAGVKEWREKFGTGHVIVGGEDLSALSQNELVSRNQAARAFLQNARPGSEAHNILWDEILGLQAEYESRGLVVTDPLPPHPA
jgi:hypothetical protein